MVRQRRASREVPDPLHDDARLALLREQGAHLPLPLRLLALVGAFTFVMFGLASALIPLRAPEPRPEPSAPTVPGQSQA